MFFTLYKFYSKYNVLIIGVGITLTLGGPGVTPVITDIRFAKGWGKKQVFMAKYLGATAPGS